MYFSPVLLCLNGRQIQKPIQVLSTDISEAHRGYCQPLMGTGIGVSTQRFTKYCCQLQSGCLAFVCLFICLFVFQDTELPTREALQSVTTERRYSLTSMKSGDHLEPL